MSIQKMENEHFVYVAYVRTESSEVEKLKIELAHYLKTARVKRDMVVDLSKCAFLINPEIAALAGFIRALQGTDHCLRIITNPKIHDKLETMKIFLEPNVAAYRDHRSFIADQQNPVI